MHSKINILSAIIVVISISIAVSIPALATPTESAPLQDYVNDQPIITNTDKELPESESRPDWLLMKEREIAEEQAVANQSATLPEPPAQAAQPTPRTSATQNTAPVPEQDETTTVTQSTPQQNATKVAGVSSAVETKPPVQKHTPWIAYASIAVVVVLVSLGAYRLFAYKTEYN